MDVAVEARSYETSAQPDGEVMASSSSVVSQGSGWRFMNLSNPKPGCPTGGTTIRITTTKPAVFAPKLPQTTILKVFANRHPKDRISIGPATTRPRLPTLNLPKTFCLERPRVCTKRLKINKKINEIYTSPVSQDVLYVIHTKFGRFVIAVVGLRKRRLILPFPDMPCMKKVFKDNYESAH